MKNLIQLSALIFVLAVGSVNAHPSHGEKPQTINKKQAITKATYQMQDLINSGQLDNSWAAAKVTNAVYERRDSRFNWIVSFEANPPNKNIEALVIYLTNTGSYVSNSLNETDQK